MGCRVEILHALRVDDAGGATPASSSLVAASWELSLRSDMADYNLEAAAL